MPVVIFFACLDLERKSSLINRLIHIHVKGVGKGHGDLDGRVGIIALTRIQEPGDPADIAEIFVKKAILATRQGQDDTVFGNLFHKLGVIIGSRSTILYGPEKMDINVALDSAVLSIKAL